MSELTYTLPEKGEARSASDAKIKTGLSEIKTVVNANVGFAAIRGKVNSSGELKLGSGFTSEKTGTGAYKIKFTSEFAAEPITVVSPFGGTEAKFALVVESASPKKEVIFKLMNAAGEAKDQGFYFQTIGS